ncbi:hypothetical protein HHL11_05520 [Ramlibacter sp. G-1-2-2]|uniref:Class I SAM-dependent methyltransferase n=1 Tax=Ramlibacter agri TaxID=2728837 RepID=A0A848H243_9BURK|nr:class I SAM-dependent methyltransferase [Ramlibacter agri]NML43200.1 hypothetical protein [Ramlibacter agri]
MTTPTPEVLAVIEEALVQHRAFGDSAYIVGQLEVAFLRRLERVAEAIPAAGELVAAFARCDAQQRYRLAGNTVLRCAVQHAYTRLETGKDVGLTLAESEQVILRTLQHLAEGRGGTPHENGSIALQRLGDQDFHGWIWNDAYPDDAYGHAFRRILDLEYGGVLCSIDDSELAMLRQGEQLLRELLPDLGRSALTHAHQVGCFPDLGFWRGKVSSSQIRMGGTIFLNRNMLRNPWCTAEHLLHESLHQKLYDFRHGHSLLDVDAPMENSPRVVSLWNAQEFNRANHWDTHRAFAAFHVYAQLALLATLAERRAGELEPRYGPFRGMVSSRKALDRARYLGEELHTQCASHLGLAGLRMRDWLMTILEHLDPAPPPRGAYVHLMLDLYVREANRMEMLLRAPDVAPAFVRELANAAELEIEASRYILSAVGAQPQLEQLDRQLAQPEQQFPEVRRCIAQALLQASPSGYGLNTRAKDGFDADLAVRRMVELGSDNLVLAQAGVPRAVAAAKRRAREMRFVGSSQDEVGRLLSMLAAAVPRAGRVLEVGTGVGVGLAWITTGLHQRRDVEVASIEGDRRLLDSACTWPWPEGVRLLAGDACELLPTLGDFDLVFADAAPVKYGQLDALLRLLRPGGVLVVDDLCATPTATRQEMAERDGLRLALLRHPSLQAVELDWSTRVVLATRIRDTVPA